MITGWLAKILIGIVLIGGAVMELGSPLIARAQADDAAHEVANEASFRLRDANTQATLDDACKTEAAKQSVEVVTCEINASNQVHVVVHKQARSFLLDRFAATKDWYDVQATATAERR